MTKKLILAAMLASIAFSTQANTDADKQAAYAAYRIGDYRQAFEMFSRFAHERDAEVLYRLGQMYRNGWGVEKNLPKAAAWYQNAADQGHAPAMYNLAGMYHNGQGVTKDINAAIRLATGAASLGYTKACIYLGDVYAKGLGVGQDLKRAYGWYDLAAKERDPVAVINRSAVQRLMSPDDLQAAKSLQLLDTGLQQKYAAIQAEKEAAREAELAAAANPVSAPPAALQAGPAESAPRLLAPAPAIAVAPEPAPAPVRQAEPVRETAPTPPPAPEPVAVARPAPKPEPVVTARVAAKPRAFSGVTREVRPGDTLYGIARQLKGNQNIGMSEIVSALKRENPELIDGPLRVGQRIRVPDFGGSTSFAAAEFRSEPRPAYRAPAPQPVAQPRPAPVANAATVEVRPGDTLFSIAKRLRNNPAIPVASIVSALQAANPWVQGGSLRPGDRLKVPTFSASANVEGNLSAGRL